MNEELEKEIEKTRAAFEKFPTFEKYKIYYDEEENPHPTDPDCAWDWKPDTPKSVIDEYNEIMAILPKE